LEDSWLPAPSEGEVTVKVKAVGLNFADVFTVLGMYDAAPSGERVVPGLEFSGVIEAIGVEVKEKKKKEVKRSADGKRYEVVESAADEEDNARGGSGRKGFGEAPRFRVGDRVMGVTRFGSYSTAVNVGTSYIRRIPDEWTFEQGAAFCVQALTAWYGLIELGQAQPGKAVLVHSAAGGVGQFALQICSMMGMVPIAIVGSKSKVDFLTERCGLQKEQVVVRSWRTGEFGKRLDRAIQAIGRNATGVDIVMDSVAGKYFEGGYSRLAPNGRHVIFGAASYTPRFGVGIKWWNPEFWLSIVPKFLSRPKLDVQKMIGENRAVMGFNLIWLTDGTADPARLGVLMDAMLKPSVRWQPAVISREYDFSMALDALRYFKSGKSVGKVVLTVGKDTEDKPK